MVVQANRQNFRIGKQSGLMSHLALMLTTNTSTITDVRLEKAVYAFLQRLRLYILKHTNWQNSLHASIRITILARSSTERTRNMGNGRYIKQSNIKLLLQSL
jgi:hypothetical protein